MESFEFSQLGRVDGAKSDATIDRLSDIKVRAELAVGGSDVYLGDVLEWRVGNVIELDALYGDSMDLRVNGKSVGRGELVVLDDSTLGIRIVKLGN